MVDFWRTDRRCGFRPPVDGDGGETGRFALRAWRFWRGGVHLSPRRVGGGARRWSGLRMESAGEGFGGGEGLWRGVLGLAGRVGRCGFRRRDGDGANRDVRLRACVFGVAEFHLRRPAAVEAAQGGVGLRWIGGVRGCGGEGLWRCFLGVGRVGALGGFRRL